MSQDKPVLPCPFCGEQPKESFSGEEHWVACESDSCDVCPAIAFSNLASARTAWNRRSLERQGSGVDTRRLDWLDQHCAFVADEKYKIGPFAIGELRQLADAGLAADWVEERIAAAPQAQDAQTGEGK